MGKTSISESLAEELYGVTVNHERMENGELRFRMNSKDGGSYIRTVSTAKKKAENKNWQNAHFHKNTIETYVVQSGSMIFASREGDTTRYELYREGGVISTTPAVPHNVLLFEGSVIHTIKVSNTGEPDWHPDELLDSETKALTEEEAMNKAQENGKSKNLDERFPAYVDLYISFDSIIWQMPAFLIGAVTVLIGLAVGLFGSDSGSAPAFVWGSVFVASSTIMFLGAFSLWRIRLHQGILEAELRKLEEDGYFHERLRAGQSSIVPRAPTIYMIAFLTIAVALGAASFLVYSGNPRLLEMLRVPSSSETVGDREQAEG